MLKEKGKSYSRVGLGSSLRSEITGKAGEELGSAVVLAPVHRSSTLREVTLWLEISGEGDVRKKGIIEGWFCFLQKYSNC